MGTRYIAAPKSAHMPVEVATGTSLKTLLQIATPSTTNIRILGWSVSFDGVTAGAAKGLCALVDVDAAATVTALTPEKYKSAYAQASLCVGGTSATGYDASDEGSITDSKLLDYQDVDPQTGYTIWFPDPPVVAVSRFLRIRVTFAATVNCLPWIAFEEPAE